MTSFKFGEGFELDPQAYELRLDGRVVRLERIPMEILLLLLERRPDLVTREQIAARIWGQDVFVDTGNSINGAIHKIRLALKDDPENPRFIRTVTAKGYRFIAPLVADEPEAADPMAASPVAATPVVTPAVTAARRWPILLVTLALVGAGAAGIALFRSRPNTETLPSSGRLMLAVLPFDNLTGDPGQDYFSDGFTEEMITRLGSLSPRQLGVIARTSVMSYKDARVPLDRLARELGVQYVLEGSVRLHLEQVRITAQLIDAKDQTHLWARQYDRHQTDVLRVQEEIAQAIAGEIQLALGEARTLSWPSTVLSRQGYEAYDRYLRGRYHWNKRTPDGFRSAIASFQEALAINPNDARVHAGLADAYALMGTFGIVPQDEVIPKARTAALRALEIDPHLAAAHTSLALIHEFADYDWEAAGDRFRRAIELDENYATAHHWYAEYLGFQGRFDEALAEIARARQLDPLSLSIAADQGVILYFARQYAPAIEQLRAVLAIEPTFGRAQMIIYAYAQLGRFDAALEQISAWEAIEEGPWFGSQFAHVLGRLGRIPEAREAMQRMEESNQRWQIEPYLMRATAYLGMGSREEALAVLQEACDHGSNQLIALKVDPVFDPIRSEPRFQDLLRCARLAP